MGQENRIKIRDLECYEKADKTQSSYKAITENYGFDLSKVTNDTIRAELEQFIRYRGRTISLSSIRFDTKYYNQFCGAMNSFFPEIDSLKTVEFDVIEQGCRKWLMKNGKKYKNTRYSKCRDRSYQAKAPVIGYAKMIYDFFHQDESRGGRDDDVWDVEKIGFYVRVNPVKNIKTISFRKIIQPGIKEEVKKIIMLHLRKKALGTILLEITSVARFSAWIEKNHPEIDTLLAVNRTIIEEYLLYINTEATERKEFASDLKQLKGVFATASIILDAQPLDRVFLNSDIPRVPERVYRSYSDNEIKRLNSPIVDDMDEQMARALILHQILGTRISEVLTLKQAALRKNDNGRDVVGIYQIKTCKSYVKILSPEALELIKKSIEYTNARFGKQEYVFVNDRDPTKPMQYGRIQDAMIKMIVKHNLKDDNGNKFTVGTHIMRRTYGRKLAEMDVDDVTIAKMLGQTGLRCLKYYRRLSPKKLYEATKDVLKEIDTEIKGILGGWNGEGCKDIREDG